jgi:pimeloyl-ACP methyl ester carboxylesterase
MPRGVLVPGLGLDARSSSRLRALLPADVVLLPGMGLRRLGPALVAAAPVAELVELPGAAHLTVQTHPAEVAEVLRTMG